MWFVKIQQVSIRGIPDLLGCYRGFLFAFELKVGSNKASPLQAHVIKEILNAGGIARVVTPENLEECIVELLNAGNIKKAGN